MTRLRCVSELQRHRKVGEQASEVVALHASTAQDVPFPWWIRDPLRALRFSAIPPCNQVEIRLRQGGCRDLPHYTDRPSWRFGGPSLWSFQAALISDALCQTPEFVCTSLGELCMTPDGTVCGSEVEHRLSSVLRHRHQAPVIPE